MTYFQHNDVDTFEPLSFSGGSGTALLTPDTENEPKDPWSDNASLTGSDYSVSTLTESPWAAAGDDLDDDEAYFLEDEDDDDDDYEEDYDDEDDDDYDDEGDESDSDTDSDDEEL